MAKSDRQPEATGQRDPGGSRSGSGSRLPEAADVRALIAAVTRFAAGFESGLRQIEPPLTLSQLAALDMIAAREGMRPFRLATQMGTSRQLAWQTCKRLESLGLVAMQNHEAGRRGVEVTITDSGGAYLGLVNKVEEELATKLGEDSPRAGSLHSCRRMLNQMTVILAAREEADGADDRDKKRARKSRTK